MHEEQLKKISEELAKQLCERFAAPEVKDVVAATEKATDDDTGTFEVVITTENLDRYQEVISLDGWETDHYMANPVVLWGHDHGGLPIGITTGISISDGKMVARGKFAPASANPFAQQVRKLYDLGMMRATSVGFLEKEREGNLITKAELLEFSFVSIPANPYALSTLVKHDLSVNELVTKGIVSIERDADPEEGGTVPQSEPQDEPETPHETGVEPSESDTEPETDPEGGESQNDTPEPAEGRFYIPNDIAEDFRSVAAEAGYEITEEKACGGCVEFVLRAASQAGPAQPDEKALLAQTAQTLVPQLKELTIALEVFAGEDQEPEGDAVPEAEEEKQFREFDDTRRSLQKASTTVGEVLAEMRQAVESRSEK